MNLYETKLRDMGYDVERLPENGCYQVTRDGKLFMGNTI